jgi:hypothetical protein
MACPFEKEDGGVKSPMSLLYALNMNRSLHIILREPIQHAAIHILAVPRLADGASVRHFRKR